MNVLRIYLPVVILLLLLQSCGNDGPKENQVEAAVEVAAGEESWISETTFDVLFPTEQGNPVYSAYGVAIDAKTGSFEQVHGAVYDEALAGRRSAYLSNFLGEPESEAIGAKELQAFLTRTDTIYTENLETGELVPTEVEASMNKTVLSGWVVRQEWNLNQGTFSIRNTELGFSRPVFNESSGEFRGLNPSFYVDLKTEAQNSAGGETWPMETQVTIDTVQYLQARSLVDLKDVPTNVLASLGSSLFERMEQSNDGIYSDPACNTPIGADELKLRLELTDTVYTENPETGEMVQTALSLALEKKDVIGLRFVQRWSYFPKAQVLRVEVLSYAPIVANLNPITGEFMGFYPLAWFSNKG